MFDRINRKDLKKIIKIYILFLIPISIGLFFLITYISDLEIETTKRLQVAEQKQKIETVEYIIKSKVESNISDLMVIKDSEEMVNYENLKKESNRIKLAELFIRIAKNKEEFDMIRLLDNEGKEIIKVKNSLNGSPYIVNEKNLNDNQGVYFFKHADDLSERQVYISPMDLTVENGEIEKPYKPSIRFATPIYNELGERQGILVISYLGDHLIKIFNEYTDNQEYISTDIINNEGYYISEDYNQSFGFDIAENQEYNIKIQKPELWERIHNKEISDKYFNIDGINYCLVKIDLKEVKNAISPENSWYVISSFHDKFLPEIKRDSAIDTDRIFFFSHTIVFIGLFIIVFLFYYFTKSRKNLNIIQVVADNSNDAVFVTDSKYIITYVNKSLEDMTGYRSEELIGSSIDILKTNRHDKKFYRKIHKEVGEKGSWKGKIWNKRKDGMVFISTLTLIGENENRTKGISSYIGILNEFKENNQEKNIKTILEESSKQILSEREYHLEELIQKNIDKEERFSIVYLYIKNYNILSANYNKEEYSIIINKINQKIKNLIGKNNFLTKLSNGEYILQLRNIYKKEDINKFMKNFFINLSKPQIYKDREIFFDIKCGIAVYPYDGKKGRDLINNAKIALNAIKEQNYDYQIYHRSSRDKLLYESKIDKNIKEAVKNNELYVWYQPQIDSNTGKIIGGEALLRWYNKELGLVPPYLFIPIAERNGSIIQIGNFVIEEVFNLIKTMGKSCGEILPISINMSPEQLKYKGIIEIFKSYNKKYKVDFKNIKIEITEGMLIDSMEMTNKKLKEFKDLGMNVSIDDFGTGFSSLSYLKSLRVDELKIDREFIKNIPLKDDGSIAKAVTNLAKNLNKNVIAEGVESKEQIDFLKSIGCFKIQGYYYSRPIAKDKFIKFACEKNN